MTCLVGTSGDLILWWRNRGTPTDPAFRYRRFVRVGDKRDFTSLQGARIKLRVDDSGWTIRVDDFDLDGIGDLAVAAAYRDLRVFLNTL